MTCRQSCHPASTSLPHKWHRLRNTLSQPGDAAVGEVIERYKCQTDRHLHEDLETAFAPVWQADHSKEKHGRKHCTMGYSPPAL